MRVQLIDRTSAGAYLVAKAMRFSRNYDAIDEILQHDQIVHLIDLAFKSGHMSVFEHPSYSFGVVGCSRTCSHQIVRHRHMSFVQFSQRYSKKQNNFVIPKVVINRDDDIASNIKYAYNFAHRAYQDLLKQGVKPEDARFVLPNGQATSFIVTANARAWMHFFKLRLSPEAQWEIREVAENIFTTLKWVEPLLFNEEVRKYYE